MSTISDSGDDSSPPQRIKCTFKDCLEVFSSEQAMRGHKKYSEEHDYCYKCDEDFANDEEFLQHKITAPEKHNKACRVCGEEFKSTSGLKRHIEVCHKVDQKLTCFACGSSFYRASLFIEHIEFGSCKEITPNAFVGHIVHKQLIHKIRDDNALKVRFGQKTAKYNAALDYDQEGGISLDDNLAEDKEVGRIEYSALEPEIGPNEVTMKTWESEYPALSSKSKASSVKESDVTSAMDDLSFDDQSQSSRTLGPSASTRCPSTNSPWSRSNQYTWGNPPQSEVRSFHDKDPTPKEASEYSASPKHSSADGKQLKVWGDRKGKSASTTLFPEAEATLPPAEFSIAAHTGYEVREVTEQSDHFDIQTRRFWDPLSEDWVPDQFFDSMMSKYYCPFPCEQTFDAPSDVRAHVLLVHRVVRNKCPTCQKTYDSVTALIAHAESRGPKCHLNKADDFGKFLDILSGGFLGVKERVRPDHVNNPSAMIHNPRTGYMERYEPPVARYMQYEVTKPMDWQEKKKEVKVIGGGWAPDNVQW